MNEQIFIAGLAKMWWIWIILFPSLIGLAIYERRYKVARNNKTH